MVLILGASSFIGGHLARTYGAGACLGTFKSRPVADAVYFDATAMRLEDVLPPGRTFTHAFIVFAEPDIDACKADPRRSHAINVLGVRSVIDSLVRLGIKPVFMSTEQVFDGRRGGYTERDMPNPITEYGRHKLEGEHYLAAHAGDAAILRLAKVFGTDPADHTIFSAWLRQLQRGDEIRCAVDQVFSPIHVADVVAVCRTTVERDLSGTYHVSTERPYSRIDMLRALIERAELPARVVECSIDDFHFLDNRARDVSLVPDAILKASGLTFRTIEASCDELLRSSKAVDVSR